MKIKLVYGAPCSGKTTYVKDNAKDADFIFDYDRILTATTNRKLHLAEKHTLHFCILELRKKFVEVVKSESKIETFYFICSRITDSVKKLFEDMDTEEVFIKATKEDCYSRLDEDETRPDKDEWRKLIDKWFDENNQVNQMKNFKLPEMRKLENRVKKFRSLNRGDLPLMMSAAELDKTN